MGRLPRSLPLLSLTLVACAAAPLGEPRAAPEPAAAATSDGAARVEPRDALATDEGTPIADTYLPAGDTTKPVDPGAGDANVPASPATPVVPDPADADVRAALESAEAGKLAAADARLRRAIARIDRDAALEDRMLAHALLGRRQRERGSDAGARREYGKVLAEWTDPASATKTILAGSSDDPRALRRVGQALSAVGEALFFEAGQKRAKALALRPPTLSGNASDDAIRRHIATAVASWMSKRRALDDAAEQAYQKVLAIQPMPPPRWVIASASEVGTMLEALPADLEKVPIPPAIKRDPALLAAYRDALRDAMAPQRERAKAAYRACQSFAEKYAHHDAYGKTCSDRLAVLEAKAP